MSKLLLHNHPVSSYAQICRIALREKQLEFAMEVPSSFSSGDWNVSYSALNPRLQVPTLQHGDLTIFDSKVICAYLEDAFPDSTLFPFEPKSSAALKAKARMLEELLGTSYEAINWGYAEVLWYGRAQDQLAEHLKQQAIQQTNAVYKWLEDQLDAQEYFCGSVFSYADVVVFPYLNRSVYYGFGPPENSSLDKWWKRVKERPSVQQTVAEFEEAAVKLPLMKDLFARGEKVREYRDFRLEWLIKSGGMSIIQEGIEKKNIRFGWPPVKPSN